jgi:hypothetical protein
MRGFVSFNDSSGRCGIDGSDGQRHARSSSHMLATRKPLMNRGWIQCPSTVSCRADPCYRSDLYSELGTAVSRGRSAPR